MKITQLPVIAVLALLTALCSSAQQPHPFSEDVPLKLVDTISLPASLSGNFDHLAVDLSHNRLFITPEDSHAVSVIDLKTLQVLQQIKNIDKPHAVLFRGDSNTAFISDGTDGSLKIFNGDTYQRIQRIPLLKDADSIGYDPSTKYLYIDNGGGDVGQRYSMLSVVDTTEGKKLADIAIDGDTLEAMVLDGRTPKLYVNDPAKNQVVVVNRWTRKVIQSWPVTMGTKNVALAQDEYRQRLFIGCRSGQIVVLDTSTGKELQSLPIVHGVDDLVYDASSRRLYAAGDGAVSVYEEIDANHFHSLGDVPSGPVGKTALLVPALNRYFVAVPRNGDHDAAILVFEPKFSPTNMPVVQSAPWKAAYKVDAPAAEHLVMSTLSDHPILRTLGIHGIAPGQTQSVILANANQVILGKPTSDRDLTNIENGKPFAYRDTDGHDYDLWLPMLDSKERHIGLLVMEIPFAAAKDEDDAIKQAESIRQGMSAQIPDLQSLFTH
jgi:DNA-binding beta-propeller fold protein YncE